MLWLDRALCDRVKERFHSLMVALDAAYTEASPETLDRLRSATDELMRAAARIRLEVEGTEDVRTPTGPSPLFG